MSFDDKDRLGDEQKSGGANDEIKGTTGLMNILFPIDLDVWQESRRLVGDRSVRVEDLATCTSQDPVLVLDLLKVSNAMYFSGGKSPISSAKTAIVRLGSDVIVEILEKMRERPQFDEDVSHWFEQHRSRCKRTGIIARILSEALARTLCDECQTASLFMNIGELLAVAHFKETYVRLAEELSRTGIIYRLSQEFKFEAEMMGLTYLRRYGIPETVVFALDREARARTQDRAIMKPLCMAAAEIVDAFDVNRWEKLAPGKTLPPKSAVRMLQIADHQYLKIYERCSEYLFTTRLLEERRKQQPAADMSQLPREEISIGFNADTDTLQSEIQTLLRGSAAPPVVESPGIIAPPPPVVAQNLSPIEVRDQEFALDSARERTKSEPRITPEEAAPLVAPDPATQGARKVMLTLSGLLEKADNSEDLLAELLEMLVDDGPFQKSALIVISKDRRRALVVAARGPGIEERQMLSLDDQLSPLARCFSKIQSFGNKESDNSPFGSKSYALAPVDADHETPVALYADCGNDGAVPFEARRIFRMVVDVLNKRLPQIAGGIPVEV